jgi:hypothetical protein
MVIHFIISVFWISRILLLMLFGIDFYLALLVWLLKGLCPREIDFFDFRDYLVLSIVDRGK